MTDRHEREALELTSFLRTVGLHHRLAKRFRKLMLAEAARVLKRVDGTTRNELEIARTNLKEL